MNRIIQVIKDKNKILKYDHEVYCPKCNVKQFSPFDKLFTTSYDICVDCADIDFVEKNSNNIFKIL